MIAFTGALTCLVLTSAAPSRLWKFILAWSGATGLFIFLSARTFGPSQRDDGHRPLPIRVMLRPCLAALLLLGASIMGSMVGEPPRVRVEVIDTTEGRKHDPTAAGPPSGGRPRESHAGGGTTGVPASPAPAKPPPCLSPGVPAPSPIDEFMREASRKGADEGWGCPEHGMQQPDGSWQQDYPQGDAILLASPIGGGVLSTPYLELFKARTKNRLWPGATGVQVFNRTPCWGDTGDYQAAADADGEVAILFLRDSDRLGTTPVEVPVELLDEYADAISRRGRALAPSGAARTDGGRHLQRFVDPAAPETGEIVLIDQGRTRRRVTLNELFTVCNPGKPLPLHLRTG